METEQAPSPVVAVTSPCGAVAPSEGLTKQKDVEVETSQLQRALELMGFVEVAAEEYRFENSRGDVVRVFVYSVQPTKSKIDFGSAITVHHASASSLAKRE